MASLIFLHIIRFGLALAILTLGGCGPSTEKAATATVEANEIGFRLLPLYRPLAPFYTDTTHESYAKGRPVFVRLWFPLEKAGTEQITYGDFIGQLNAETQDATTPDSVAQANCYEKFKSILKSFQLNVPPLEVDNGLAQMALTPTKSWKADFPTGNQKFPLVIIGSGRPIYQLELAELLAANGFVVAAIPRLGITEGMVLPFKSEGVETYSQDLQFMIEELSALPFIDAGHLSLVAWSFEGIPFLKVAMERATPVDCLINLDAGTAYDYGVELFKRTTQTKPMSVPILHFFGKNNPASNKDFSLLKEIGTHTKVFYQAYPALEHRHFCSISSESMPRFFGQPEPAPVRQEYKALKASILAFLQADKTDPAFEFTME